MQTGAKLGHAENLQIYMKKKKKKKKWEYSELLKIRVYYCQVGFLRLETHPVTDFCLKLFQETVALELTFIELNPAKIQYCFSIFSFSLSDSLFGKIGLLKEK